jgi:ribose 5-phosphate isomerase B
MQVSLGADHAGYHLKQQLREWLSERRIEVTDVGAESLDPGDDYPDFARRVAESVARGEADIGIIICSTGIGSCIVANKVRGVRAALCHDTFCAKMSRLHNDANVLCLGANVVAPGLALEIAEAWLAAAFSGEERHVRRLGKVAEMESQGEEQSA